MFSISILFRNRCLRSSTPLQLKKFLSASKDDSSESDSSDDEKVSSKAAKNEKAWKRLNFLLQSMAKESNKLSSSGLGDKLARPKKQGREKFGMDNDYEGTSATQSTTSGEDTRASKSRTYDGTVADKAKGVADKAKKLVDAAKEVAENLGGDVKQTESELLSKLLSHSSTSTKATGDQDAPKPSVNLSELIVGMKIDRSPKLPNEEGPSRAQKVRWILESQQEQRGRERQFESRSKSERQPVYYRSTKPIGRVDIFGGEPLGIFQPSDLKSVTDSSSAQLQTWKQLQERELKLAITHPPSNIFEEMIQWTEQGKLWKFPIDNEQGLEEEAKIYFAKHVFLEHHLEPWCPRQGPIRHFMELVCVGLSKNPYMTVQDKEDHIEWFRQYFEKKQDLLKEMGLLGNVPDSSDHKSIEA